MSNNYYIGDTNNNKNNYIGWKNNHTMYPNNVKNINTDNNVKNNTTIITTEEINKLLGLDPNLKSNNNDWMHCDYCEKIHPYEYFIPGMAYCTHCWAWLNSHELDLESGNYKGQVSYDEIKKMLIKVYPIHCEAKCINQDCIFTKISKYSEIKILNKCFVDLLKLDKTPIQSLVNINYKNKNLDINYENSYIVI